MEQIELFIFCFLLNPFFIGLAVINIIVRYVCNCRHISKNQNKNIMKTLKLKSPSSKSFFAIVAVLFSLSSISCGKETPEDLKETRIDARSGILEVDTYYKSGVKDRQIIQGNAEVRFYTIEVDSVKATSLQENTSGRVNGWIVEPMNEGDSFVYYPELDELTKESISEIATEGLPEIWKEAK